MRHDVQFLLLAWLLDIALLSWQVRVLLMALFGKLGLKNYSIYDSNKIKYESENRIHI